VKPSPHQLAALAVSSLVLAGVVRWQWQPRRAAAAERDDELEGTLERMAAEVHAAPLLGLADRGPELLRWQPSDACTQVYAFTIDETFANETVAAFLGRAEEHSRWLMAVGPHPRSEGQLAALLVAESSAEHEQGEHPRLRGLFVGPDSRSLGPAAPDFACRNRTWDPLEDALALGWPELPLARVRPGDHWRGQVVGGRCHETACLDAEGHFDRARSCQARAWDEQLAGWLQPDSGAAMAVLRSTWDDGHEGETSTEGEFGILTWRELTIAEGRPTLAQAEIWHRWTGVSRRLELRALGACESGRGDLSETIAQVRASLPAPG